MGTVRFILRSDKASKHGNSQIQGVYSIKGNRKYFKTKEKCLPGNWTAAEQLAVYLDRKEAKKLHPEINYNQFLSAKEVADLNSDLLGIRREITEIEKKFGFSKTAYSTAMVIDSLEGNHTATKTEAPKNELIDFIDQYISDHLATREPGSLSVYKALKNHLIEYRDQTKRKISFESIDYSFFQSFQNFLLSIIKTDKAGNKYKALNNTTIAKQLSTIKTFLSYARKQGIIVSDKYKEFKIKKDTLEVIALTNEEFETLFYFDLANKKLSNVRDIFCFACSTGLRYSDLALLKREHIRNDEIRLTVKKTKEPLTIPLNPFSNSILGKYKGQHKPLPMISNQKMNDYLKELCELAGIKEDVEIVRYRGAVREVNTYKKYQLIGVHTGRKTFATLSLEKGMSAEETMAITGHRDYKSFQRYVKVTEQRKKVVMLKAWGGELSSVKVKAM